MTNKNLLALISSVELKLYFARHTVCDRSIWFREEFVPTYEQLYLVTKGEGIITVDGVEYRPKQGQLIYMPSGHKMSYRMADGCELEKFWCHFNAKVAGRELLWFFKCQTIVTLSPKDFKLITKLFQEIKQFPSVGNQSVSEYLNGNAFLNKIIAICLDVLDAELIAETGESEHGFSAVLQYIENHLSEPIPMTDLAGLAGLHPNYFIGRFHAFYGYSPLQYIKKMRMDKAKEHLCRTDMTIGEIAFAVGFSDPLYFSATFKSVCGFSPTEYRKMFL